MNWKGVVSAFVFLTVVSAVRMGDKPLFTKGKDRDTFVKQIEDANKKEESKSKYSAPAVR
tara:strand:+ start:225 stop:404 length:180 start_codon:yes stop_codon:yes gene_type:complete